MKRMLKKAISVLLAAAMSFAAAACTTENLGEENLVKVWRGTIGGNMAMLNPLNYNMQTDGDVMSYILMPLVEWNPTTNTYTYMGGAAKDLPEVSEDGLTWTFHLKEGLEWSDGTPINAHTYEYTVKMRLDPKLVNRNAYTLYDNIQVLNAEAYALGDLAEEEGFESVTWEDVGCKAVDDYTLVFTLAQKPLSITGIQSLGGLWPVHEASFEAGMNEDRTETTYGTKDFLDMPTCGPFKITQYEPDQYYVFEKDYNYTNADYYVIERREWRYVSQATVSDQLFEQGKLDSRSIGYSNYDQFKEDPRVVISGAGQPWHININMTSEEFPILQDVNFRKALFYGVDRMAVAEGVFKVYIPSPFYVMTSTFLGDVLAGEETYSYRSTPEAQAITPEGDGYDPELALEYFAKAYEANGNQKITLEMAYFDNQDTWKMMAEVIQESWMSLFGEDKLEIVIVAQNANVAYQNYRDANYQLGLASLTQSASVPWNNFRPYTTAWEGRTVQYSNAEFDELVNRVTKGDLLHADTQTKTEILAQLEAMLLDACPTIPVFQNTNWIVYSDRTTLLSREYSPGIGFVIKDLVPIAATNMAVDTIE